MIDKSISRLKKTKLCSKSVFKTVGGNSFFYCFQMLIGLNVVYSRPSINATQSSLVLSCLVLYHISSYEAFCKRSGYTKYSKGHMVDCRSSKFDSSIKKSITSWKFVFAKFHKISMFRYRKIGFGCLKCPRMISRTK